MNRYLWVSPVLFFLLAVFPLASADPEEVKPKVRFSIQTPQEVEDLSDLIQLWQEAEAWGFDAAWTFDHFMPISGNLEGPCHDGWMLLSFLAAKTSKIRLGCLVTGNTYRHPAVLAKMATTVDHISGGRLELGIGAGWFEPEHTAYGIPFYTARERAKRLEEALEVIRLLWTQEKASFQGQYYRLDEAPFEPKPLQKPHPPILIGGIGKKWTLPLVARYAQAWNLLPVPFAQITDLLQTLSGYCQQYGRSCEEIEKSYLTRLVLSNNPERIEQTVRSLAQLRGVSPEEVRSAILAGNAEEVQEQIQRYVDAGITHIIVGMRPPYDREGLRRFAKEVMPAFR